MNCRPYTKLLLERAPLLIAIALLIVNLPRPAYSQGATSAERDQARTMLRTIKEEIKKSFYDASFHGMDLEARFKEAENRIRQAQSQSQLYGILAQVMQDLDDPNTFFLSPAFFRIVDYGFSLIMIGDKCFVNAVKPGSDAEMKGLKLGDEVLDIAGYAPTRRIAWQIKYGLFLGRPRGVLPVAVQSAGSQPRRLEISSRALLPNVIHVDREGNTSADSKLEKLDKELKSERLEINSEVMLWKSYTLSDEERVADGFKKARNYESLIIDLRDCNESFGAGDSFESIRKLQEFISYLFDRDIKIADVKKRKEIKSLLAKTRGDNVFRGKLVVIINSVTSGAAELFARIIQLEKRGKVIGDRSQGATRLNTGSLEFTESGVNSGVVYGISISDRELILSDGQSLDGVGVTPDKVILPTAADLASKRDPVLSDAAGLLDVRLSPGRAGSLLKPISYTLWTK